MPGPGFALALALLAASPGAAAPPRRPSAPAAVPGGAVPGDWINPLDLMPPGPPRSGSWADGTSRPLSSRFATLADAQAVYPRAHALSDEIDGHALQKAFDACPVGGTVYLPAGSTFVVNFTIAMWKGIHVVGGGTAPSAGRYWDQYANVQVWGDLAAIRFDRNTVPAGHANPGLQEYGPTFRNVRFRGTFEGGGRNQTGLLLGQAFSGGSVEHCQFIGLNVAIGMSGTWESRIVDNLFQNVGTGVRIDSTWAYASPSHGWNQVNALRVEHNNFQGQARLADTHGVYVLGAANSLTIRENTFEHFEGAGSTAITLATYPDDDLKTGAKDPAQPVTGVEVSGNYEEANSVFLELGRPLGGRPGGSGSPDARRTALSAPVDVLVTQNQYNCDGSANGSKIRLNACWRCTIRDNSARGGVWPHATVAQEIEFVNAFRSSGMGAGWETNDNLGRRGFHDDLDVVAERGWVGYPQNAKPYSVRMALRQRTSTRAEAGVAARDWNAVSVGNSPAAAWQARRRFATGDLVRSGRDVYRVIVGGASGNTAPSGTGCGILDGSVRWAWYAPAAIDDRWSLLSVHAGTPGAPIDRGTFTAHKRDYVMGWRAMIDPSSPVTP